MAYCTCSDIFISNIFSSNKVHEFSKFFSFLFIFYFSSIFAFQSINVTSILWYFFLFFLAIIFLFNLYRISVPVLFFKLLFIILLITAIEFCDFNKHSSKTILYGYLFTRRKHKKVLSFWLYKVCMIIKLFTF